MNRKQLFTNPAETNAHGSIRTAKWAKGAVAVVALSGALGVASMNTATASADEIATEVVAPTATEEVVTTPTETVVAEQPVAETSAPTEEAAIAPAAETPVVATEEIAPVVEEAQVVSEVTVSPAEENVATDVTAAEVVTNADAANSDVAKIEVVNRQSDVTTKDVINTDVLVSVEGVDVSYPNSYLKYEISKEGFADGQRLSVQISDILGNSAVKVSEDAGAIIYTQSLGEVKSGTSLTIPVLTSISGESGGIVRYKVGLYSGDSTIPLSEGDTSVNVSAAPIKNATLVVSDSTFGKDGESYIAGYRAPDGSVPVRGFVAYDLVEAQETKDFRGAGGETDLRYFISYDRSNFAFLNLSGENVRMEITGASMAISSIDETPKFGLVYVGNNEVIPDTNLSVKVTSLNLGKYNGDTSVNQLTHKNTWSSTSLPSTEGNLAVYMGLTPSSTIDNPFQVIPVNSQTPVSKVMTASSAVNSKIVVKSIVAFEGDGRTVAEIKTIDVAVPVQNDAEKYSLERLDSITLKGVPVRSTVYLVKDDGSLEEVAKISNSDEQEVVLNRDLRGIKGYRVVADAIRPWLIVGSSWIYNSELTASFSSNIDTSDELNSIMTGLPDDTEAKLDVIPNNLFNNTAVINDSDVIWYSNYAGFSESTTKLDNVIGVNGLANAGFVSSGIGDNLRKGEATIGSDLKFSNSFTFDSSGMVSNDSKIYFALPVGSKVLSNLANYEIIENYNQSGYNLYLIPVSTGVARDIDEEIRVELTNDWLLMDPDLSDGVATIPVYSGIVTNADHVINIHKTDVDDILDVDNDGLFVEEGFVDGVNKSGDKIVASSKFTVDIPVPKSLYIYDTSSNGGAFTGVTNGVFPGSDVVVKASAINTTDTVYDSVSVITVLSKIGDTILNGDDRGSDFSPVLKNISPVEGYDVYVSTGSISPNVEWTAIDNWTPLSQVGDLSTVTAIKWVSKPNVDLGKFKKLELPYTLKMPDSLSYEAAPEIITLSAISTDGGTSYLEGRASKISLKERGVVVTEYLTTDGQVIDLADLSIKAELTGFIGDNYDMSQYSYPTVRDKKGNEYRFINASEDVRGTFTGARIVKNYYELSSTTTVSEYDKLGSVIAEYYDNATGEKLSFVLNGVVVNESRVVEDGIVSHVRKTVVSSGGTEISSSEVEELTGLAYDTKPVAYKELKTEDGSVYVLIGLKEGSAPEAGNVPVGSTVVSYLYSKVKSEDTVVETKGTVNVRYIDNKTNKELIPMAIDINNQTVYTTTTTDYFYTNANGEKVPYGEPKVVVVSSGLSYSTGDLVKQEIHVNGKKYAKLAKVVGEKAGIVKEGLSFVDYYYSVVESETEEKDFVGSVRVKYVDNANGLELKESVLPVNEELVEKITTTKYFYIDENNNKVYYGEPTVVVSRSGFKYNVDEHIPTEISLGGNTYVRLSKQIGNSAGYLPEGMTEIVQFYSLVRSVSDKNDVFGNVVVKFVDEASNLEIIPSIIDTQSGLVETIVTTTRYYVDENGAIHQYGGPKKDEYDTDFIYDVSEYKKDEIVDANGGVWVKTNQIKGFEKGSLVGGTTEVIYYYAPKMVAHEESKVITRTVKYKLENGEDAFNPVIQTVKFVRAVKTNLVTKETEEKETEESSWISDDSVFAAIDSPALKGYKANVLVVDVVSATPDMTDEEIVVVYSPTFTTTTETKEVIREIKFLDENGVSVSDPIKQVAVFTRTVATNDATGEIVYGDWSESNKKFDSIDSPNIPELSPSVSRTEEVLVTPDSENVEVVVVYSKVVSPSTSNSEGVNPPVVEEGDKVSMEDESYVQKKEASQSSVLPNTGSAESILGALSILPLASAGLILKRKKDSQ